jgi:hypothetical protein
MRKLYQKLRESAHFPAKEGGEPYFSCGKQ